MYINSSTAFLAILVAINYRIYSKIHSGRVKGASEHSAFLHIALQSFSGVTLLYAGLSPQPKGEASWGTMGHLAQRHTCALQRTRGGDSLACWAAH